MQWLFGYMNKSCEFATLNSWLLCYEIPYSLWLCALWFATSWWLWYYDIWTLQKSKFYVNVAVSIFICTPPPLIHSCPFHYSSSLKRKCGIGPTHTKIPPCQNTTYSKRICLRKRGFRMKRWFLLLPKAVRHGFFRHSHGSCRKNLVFFYKKLVAFL